MRTRDGGQRDFCCPSRTRAWRTRAASLLRRGYRLPTVSGEERGVWARFTFAADVPVTIAESHREAASAGVRRGVTEVWNVDAHHDCGYRPREEYAMELVIACPSCGQKNRVDWSRLGEERRCGRCKKWMDVKTVVAASAAIVREVAARLRNLPADEWQDNEEAIAEVFERRGVMVTSRDEDGNEDEDDEEED